jgi:purine-nucleoside phosphorylase
VLGSGLGGLADELHEPVEIPYAEIPGWPTTSAAGHAGVLALGSVGGLPLAVMRGRAHLYDGIGPERVVFGVRALARLGVTTLVVTNASGAIDEAYRPGQLVLITDHVNLMGSSPLVGPNDDELGPRFPDLHDAYDPELRGLEVGEGVYGGWLGPQFETPAEIRFMRAAGCDLAGMSTVPEVIAARHLGLRCLGISVVTNMAAGIGGRIDHESVLAVAGEAGPALTRLLRELLPSLAS